MKLPALLTLLTLGCFAMFPLRAAEPAPETTQAPLTTAQIDELLAPIALYPDPLVAIILPAATFPADIVMAARYLDAKRDPDAIEDQPWDDSVKSLAHYPDVVKWMDENLEWTRQLGNAFTLQPVAMLAGTQRLRASAIAAGSLKTTTQQTVIVEKEVIRIVPAQREVIFVPVYDPYWAYHSWPHYGPRPLITFSPGYRTGLWLSYHFNWGVGSIVIVNRPYRSVVWHNYPAWHYPSHTVVHHHHVWRPAPVVVQQARRDYERRPVRQITQPVPNQHVRRDTDRGISRGPDRNVERPTTPRRDIALRGTDETRRPVRADDRSVVTRPDNPANTVRTPSAAPRVREERIPAARPESVNREAIRPERTNRSDLPRGTERPARQITPAAPAPTVTESRPRPTTRPETATRPARTAIPERQVMPSRSQRATPETATTPTAPATSGAQIRRPNVQRNIPVAVPSAGGEEAASESGNRRGR